MVDPTHRHHFDYTAEPVLTGSPRHPHVVTLFTKADSKVSYHNLPSLVDQSEHVPVLSIPTGIARIIAAVEEIFHHLGKIQFSLDDPHLQASWEAFKHLLRGLIACVPIAGNLALYAYDSVKKCYYIHQIEKDENVKNDQYGIAIDGKVLFTKQVAEDGVIKKSNSPQKALLKLDILASSLLEKAEEMKKTSTVAEILLPIS